MDITINLPDEDRKAFQESFSLAVSHVEKRWTEIVQLLTGCTVETESIRMARLAEATNATARQTALLDAYRAGKPDTFDRRWQWINFEIESMYTTMKLKRISRG